MTRKKFFSSLSAICLSMALVMSSTTFAFAEEATDTEAISATTVSAGDVNPSTSDGDAAPSTSDGDAGTTTPDSGNTGGDTDGSGTEATLIKLGTPKPVWGEHWETQWSTVENCEGYYDIELYKDGVLYFRTSWSGLTWEPISTNTYNEIYDSGVYTFRVRAAAQYNDEVYCDGDWSEFSEARTYTKPANVLGTTTAYWDTEEFGLLHFNSVENAGGYRVHLYKKGGDSFYECGASWGSTIGRTDEAGVDMTWSMEYAMEEAGEYYVTVQALSGDIDTYANGAEGPASAVYDTSVTIDNVQENIADAITYSSNASEALEAVTAANSISQIQHAMHNDAEVLAQVKGLEEDYIKEKGITVSSSASAEASQYVDASKVSMVGAGLNAEAGNVNLDISVPSEKVYVNNNHYAKSVQLDIKLTNDGAPISNLKMPITITIPAPAGIDLNKLALLHYNADGSYEAMNFKVENGMITFTVTHFSTFVFAEEGKAGIEPGGDELDGSNNENGGNTTSAGTTNNTTAAPTATTSPKTGESSSNVARNLLLAAGVFGILSLVSKRREYESNC